MDKKEFAFVRNERYDELIKAEKELETIKQMYKALPSYVFTDFMNVLTKQEGKNGEL